MYFHMTVDTDIYIHVYDELSSRIAEGNNSFIPQYFPVWGTVCRYVRVKECMY